MRKAFLTVDTIAEVVAAAPWAAAIYLVEGGVMVFESKEEGETWQAQQ